MLLREHEHIDDLQYKGLMIILSDALPSFTTDAVLLSHFLKAKPTDRVADLGSGTGVISLLIHGRYGASVCGFEIDSRLCDMANRSAALNDITGRVSFINTDYTRAYAEYNGHFHICVANPPYFKQGRGFSSPDPARALARTQCGADIDATCTAATRLLRSGGMFYICYPAADLTDLLCALRAAKLEPKTLRFVCSTPEKAPYLALVRAKKDGGAGLEIGRD